MVRNDVKGEIRNLIEDFDGELLPHEKAEYLSTDDNALIKKLQSVYMDIWTSHSRGRLVERNRTLDHSTWVENANLARA
jgi:hypothetical protein